MIPLFAFSGLFADLAANIITSVSGPDYSLYPETFIMIGVLIIPLTVILLGFYANYVVDSIYQLEQDHLSYTKAFFTHVLFGMGMYFVDPQLRRKRLYPFIALLISTLVLSVIFYRVTFEIKIDLFSIKKMADGRVADALVFMLWSFLVLYALSFIDVMVTCYRRLQKYQARKRESLVRIPDQVQQRSQRVENQNKV